MGGGLEVNWKRIMLLLVFYKATPHASNLENVLASARIYTQRSQRAVMASGWSTEATRTLAVR